jgi:hypothetical protein
MESAYVVTGTLRDERTVMLDEPVGLRSSKVRVTIEPLPDGSQGAYAEVMAEIRDRQRARGHRPRTRKEVDAYLLAERASWAE